MNTEQALCHSLYCVNFFFLIDHMCINGRRRAKMARWIYLVKIFSKSVIFINLFHFYFDKKKFWYIFSPFFIRKAKEEFVAVYEMGPWKCCLHLLFLIFNELVWFFARSLPITKRINDGKREKYTRFFDSLSVNHLKSHSTQYYASIFKYTNHLNLIEAKKQKK